MEARHHPILSVPISERVKGSRAKHLQEGRASRHSLTVCQTTERLKCFSGMVVRVMINRKRGEGHAKTARKGLRKRHIIQASISGTCRYRIRWPASDFPLLTPHQSHAVDDSCFTYNAFPLSGEVVTVRQCFDSFLAAQVDFSPRPPDTRLQCL